METNYEESYRRIMEYQNEEHLRNQKKIRWGIRCVILIPMIFLMLMFSMDSSKVVFLVLWIVSLFTIFPWPRPQKLVKPLFHCLQIRGTPGPKS